jgi:hypothetical protein
VAFALAKLLRERASDRVHCGFGCVVNYRGPRSERAGERTDVNDAATVRIEVLQRFLCREKHPENIGIKHSVELLLGDFFERHEFVNAGVVHQDIDLAGRFFRSGEKFFDVGFLRNTALHCHGFSTFLSDFIDNFVCGLFHRRKFTTTVAPSAANCFAMPAPIPFDSEFVVNHLQAYTARKSRQQIRGV